MFFFVTAKSIMGAPFRRRAESERVLDNHAKVLSDENLNVHILSCQTLHMPRTLHTSVLWEFCFQWFLGLKNCIKPL